jgi:hypothetical protein
MVVSADGSVVGSRLELQTGQRRQACKNCADAEIELQTRSAIVELFLVLGEEGAELCVQQILNLL